jgi:hypothetical protein
LDGSGVLLSPFESVVCLRSALVTQGHEENKAQATSQEKQEKVSEEQEE